MKKFLKENLGLMKRMGGDLKSREVVREMRSGFNMWTQSGNGDNNFYFKKQHQGGLLSKKDTSLGLLPYFLILLSFFGLKLVLNILLWLQIYEI